MKGQYFLPMVLVAMFLMAAIAMYFSSTNQIHAYKAYSYKPYLGDKIVKAKAEIISAFIESIYLGSFNHLYAVESELKNLSATRAENMTIQCTTDNTGNKFSLNCDKVRIDSGDDYAETNFKYNYTVPFEIKTYKGSKAYETNVFNVNDSVLIWVSGNNTDTINVTITNPSGVNVSTYNAKLINWHWNTTFKPNQTGDWLITVKDVNTSAQVNKTIHYGTTNVLIYTYNNSVPTTTFNRGGDMNITVKLVDQNNLPVDCFVKVDLTYPNGKRFTDFSGETNNGVLTNTVYIPDNSPTGNMTITATEQCTWYQNTTSVTIQ